MALNFFWMASTQTVKITRLLRAWGGGDQAALDQLAPVVYGELHRLARRYMRRENPGNTLQTTALVNEAYLRLVDLTNVSWQDRTHFFAVSAQMMRRILVDAARARASRRRGGYAPQVNLDESIDAAPMRAQQLIVLDDSLNALARMDPRKARVVELRFFGGVKCGRDRRSLEDFLPECHAGLEARKGVVGPGNGSGVSLSLLQPR